MPMRTACCVRRRHWFERHWGSRATPVSTMTGERRRFPRRVVSAPVAVSTAGRKITAMAVDASRNGMQLACDRGSLLRICPRAHLTSRADDIRLQIRVEEADGSAALELDAKVIVVRRVSQFDYRIGVEFASMTSESGQRLSGWIDSVA